MCEALSSITNMGKSCLIFLISDFTSQDLAGDSCVKKVGEATGFLLTAARTEVSKEAVVGVQFRKSPVCLVVLEKEKRRCLNKTKVNCSSF